MGMRMGYSLLQLLKMLAMGYSCAALQWDSKCLHLTRGHVQLRAQFFIPGSEM
jgi:hypothetical protein